jgi:hypothetical protein
MLTQRIPQIVEGTARPLWVPLSSVGGAGQTVYFGSVVTWYLKSGDGVLPTIAANAAPMTRPFGIVIGSNAMPGTASAGYNQYSSTYMTDYITQQVTQATANGRDWRMQEGMWIKSDPTVLVQVALLDATSVVRLPIYAHATTLTAPTEAISTAGNASGLTVTCGTTGFDFTGIAYDATYYCRKGLNKGIYRIGYDTNAGTGAKTFYQAMPYTTATAGETYVGVNFCLGRTGIDMQTTGLGINIVTSLATNYYSVECLEIHLENANDEYALVRFL